MSLFMILTYLNIIRNVTFYDPGLPKIKNIINVTFYDPESWPTKILSEMLLFMILAY